MLETTAPMPQALPPHAQLIQMAMGPWVSPWSTPPRSSAWPITWPTAPKSAAELAGPTGTHAPSLHRLMRTLASLGILTEATGSASR